VWDRVRKQVSLGRQQLRRLLVTYHALLRKCETSPPDDVELSALAAMIHSFYNGIENIFKRIAEGLDGQLPPSEFWHRELLDTMNKPGKVRPAVISESLVECLDSYLDFRHFFRHSYTFDLHWERMKTLVLDCEETLKLLEDELDRFFAAGTGNRALSNSPQLLS
jgi:hypothetical protein